MRGGTSKGPFFLASDLPGDKATRDAVILAVMGSPDERQIATARPDQNGKFQIRGLPAGNYYLAVIDPLQQGEWFDPAFLEQQTADATRLSLTEGATRTQDLRLNR